MRVLGSIVQASVLAMLDLNAHLRPRRASGLERNTFKVSAGSPVKKSERRVAGDLAASGPGSRERSHVDRPLAKVSTLHRGPITAAQIERKAG
jgi:hypothetical protein